HGGDAWLAARQALLPPTVQQASGSGGWYLLYRVPPPYLIKTSSRGELAPGVDTRGDGGQIIVAPSRNLHGPYRWLPGQAPWQRPLSAAPPDLLALLVARGILYRPRPASTPAPLPPLPAGERLDAKELLRRYLA